MIDLTTVTFDAILKRCMDRVPDTLDKREGSVIYTAIAPAAAELSTLYSLFSSEMSRAFPDTAEGIDLTNKAKERSIFRLPATAAVRKATLTGAEVPVGTRFSGGDVNYRVTKKISDGQYQLTAEELGSVGNTYKGILFPIDHVNGLTAATMTDVIIYGENEETDDALRARYYESLNTEAFGGNAAAYRAKMEQTAGVGSCKVFPTWNGGGTVKLVFTSSNGGVPSTELVQQVQAAIDPPGNTGQGKGWAPIGHTVTVQAVTGLTVNIAFKLTFDAGYNWASVQTAVTNAIKDYLAETIRGWADVNAIVVRISQLEAKILGVKGVVDIANTTLNSAANNLTLGAQQIPLLGTVTNNA